MTHRRIFALMLALALLLGTVPALAAVSISWDGECPSNPTAGGFGKHKWVKGADRMAATCTEKGTATYECAYCHANITHETPALGHSWGGWKTTKQATCQAQGEQRRTCKVCGKSETRKTDKLAHTWGEWTILTEATDHSAGTRSHTCAVCGTQETGSYDPEGTLRRGDKGDAVKALQEGLICYGTLTGAADGSFGAATQRAVIDLQQAEGLAADGVAWPQTQAFAAHQFGPWQVFSEMTDFSIGIRQRVCGRCGIAEREEEWPSPLYQRGDRGEGVKALQEALNAAGFDCGKADGDFGKKTESAVMAIEAAYGVEADGIAWPGVLKWLGLRPEESLQQDEGAPIPGAISTKNLIPTEPAGEFYDRTGIAPNPYGAQERSLKVVDKPAGTDDNYYTGADVRVHLALTIDSYDSYDLLGIDVGDGDYLDSATVDTLKPGRQLESNLGYSIYYHMVINPKRAGWDKRTVTVRLRSHTTGLEEVESCTFGPPFRPAKVTIPGSGSNILNDGAAYLYLNLKNGGIPTVYRPEVAVTVPFEVDSDGNTEIRNVQLVAEARLNGVTLGRGTIPLASKIQAGDHFDTVQTLFTNGVAEAHPFGEYRFVLRLRGTITNSKGKEETVSSLPVEIPLEIVEEDPEKYLNLVASVASDRAAYSLNDTVRIQLLAVNRTGATLQGTRISSVIDSPEFGEALEQSGRLRYLLHDGMDDGCILDYTIQPEDLAKGEITCTFIATAKTARGGESVSSKPATVRIPIVDNAPRALELSASIGDPGPFYADRTYLTRLTLRNPTGQAVTKLRLYHVGDNRDAYGIGEGLSWHDCGHGLKGWEEETLSSALDIDGSEDILTMLVIAPEYYQRGYYLAQWVVEGQLEDGTVVQSNPAYLSLTMAELQGDALELTRTDVWPALNRYSVGDHVEIALSVYNRGGDAVLPEDLRVGYYGVDGGQWVCDAGELERTLYGVTAVFAIDIAPEDVINDLWTGTFIATANGGALESNPVTVTLPTGEERFALNVEVLNQSEAPDGWWLNGETVRARVSAVYEGARTPSTIFAGMGDSVNTEVPLWVSSVEGAKALDDELEWTLDANLAEEGVCAYTFDASCLFDDGAEALFDKVTLTFPIAPAAGGVIDGDYEEEASPVFEKDLGKVLDQEAVQAKDGEGEAAETDETETAKTETEPAVTGEISPASLALVRAEYRQFGGMENENVSYALEADAGTGELRVVAMDGETAAAYPASGDALDALAKAMAGFHPESWESLPEVEAFALDAPVEVLTLTTADGAEYALSNDRESAGEILRLARCFLESYTVDAPPLALTVPAGTSAALDAPEIAWIEADGDGTLRLHGRVPGRATFTLSPTGETRTLAVDSAYNVTMEESEGE